MYSFIQPKITQMIGVAIFYGMLILIPILVLSLNTNQSADTACTSTGLATITVRFTNTTNAPATNSIATDSQTHASLAFGTVPAHQTETGQIITTKTALSNGTIAINFHTGKTQMSQVIRYGGISCGNTIARTNRAIIPSSTQKEITDNTQSATPSAVVMQPDKRLQQLPGTGVPFAMWEVLAGLMPIGVFFRKLAKK